MILLLSLRAEEKTPTYKWPKMLRGLYYTVALSISWLAYSSLLLKWSMTRSRLSLGISSFLLWRPLQKCILVFLSTFLCHSQHCATSVLACGVPCTAQITCLVGTLPSSPFWLPGDSLPSWDDSACELPALPVTAPVICTGICVKAGCGWRWKHSPITESRMQAGMHEINVGRVQTLAFFLKS